MAYQLTYGGIKLSIPTDEEENLIEKFLYFDGLELWSEQLNWRGPILSRLPLAVQPPTPLPFPGTFFYPTGASRWGWFCGLATQTDVQAMMAQAFPAGSQTVALPFVIQADDKTHPDNSGGITTQMYLLPPRVLGQTAGSLAGLYMVQLVDDRYFFQQRTPGVWHTSQLSTWQSLISSLASALGIAITSDPISDVYLTPNPDSDLYSNYENAATLLDAVAWNIGMSVVRQYNGQYQLLRFGDADPPISGATASNLTNRPTPIYRAFGGDIMDPTASGVAATPTAPMPPAWNTVLPQSVTVTFPAYQNGEYYDPERDGFFVKDSYGFVYAVEVPLSTLGTPYSQFAGFVGTKVIEDTAKAYFTSSASPTTSTPTNSDTLTSLAQQMAKDYYNLHLNGADEVYAGIRNWTPDPVNDLTFSFRTSAGVKGDQVMTRVRRKPWNYGPNQAQHNA